MRAHAETRLTEVRIVIGKDKPRVFLIPNKSVALVRTRVTELIGATRDDDFVPAEDVFPNLADPAKKPGIALRAARLRSEMTQGELATKIGCEQSDISKMESGRFPIGKNRARKLGAVLGINYRVFL